jgi:hypothetical protein
VGKAWRSKVRARPLVLVAAPLVGACALVAGLEDSTLLQAADAGGDSVDDRSPADGNTAADALSADADAGGGADTEASGPYNDMTDPANWSAFDTRTVGACASLCAGGTFDGRRVFLVPSYVAPDASGFVAVYDTTQPLADANAWSGFDTTRLAPTAKGFAGAAFDQHYVYVGPNFDGFFARGVAPRYDITQPLGADASWGFFDISTLGDAGPVAGDVGYNGVSFDGHYVYYAPNYDGDLHGHAARYDTHVDYTLASSWSVYDLVANVDPAARGFFGTVALPDAVVFTPYSFGVIVRFTPSKGSFTDRAAWTKHDFGSGLGGFGGGVTDGRFMYFPLAAGPARKYDTTKDIDQDASWESFDLGAFAPGEIFFGGAFDGRFVYFAPYQKSPSAAPASVVVRYDTLGPFGATASWTKFDLANVGPQLRGYWGALFDGANVYLLPHDLGPGAPGGFLTRFAAKAK